MKRKKGTRYWLRNTILSLIILTLVLALFFTPVSGSNLNGDTKANEPDNKEDGSGNSTENGTSQPVEESESTSQGNQTPESQDGSEVSDAPVGNQTQGDTEQDGEASQNQSSDTNDLGSGGKALKPVE